MNTGNAMDKVGNSDETVATFRLSFAYYCTTIITNKRCLRSLGLRSENASWHDDAGNGITQSSQINI